jgi:hypothetical protein
MYPRTSSVSVKLTPTQAEFIYWELLALLDHYRKSSTPLEPADESAILQATSQLELGLKRAEAVAELQLEQLRSIAKDAGERS